MIDQSPLLGNKINRKYSCTKYTNDIGIFSCINLKCIITEIFVHIMVDSNSATIFLNQEYGSTNFYAGLVFLLYVTLMSLFLNFYLFGICIKVVTVATINKSYVSRRAFCMSASWTIFSYTLFLVFFVLGKVGYWNTILCCVAIAEGPFVLIGMIVMTLYLYTLCNKTK